MPVVGVLALQGDVREHVSLLRELGVEPVLVRTPAQLASVDALILPGGESTAIAHLLTTSQLRQPLAERLAAGMPALATCAGLILLATSVLDGRDDQWSFGALDVAVRRNGYGRQVASFEAPVEVRDVGTVTGVFIRAPRIEAVGDGVEVYGTLAHEGDGGFPVVVRQGPLWASSFHPELAGDARLHALFVNSCAA